MENQSGRTSRASRHSLKQAPPDWVISTAHGLTRIKHHSNIFLKVYFIYYFYHLVCVCVCTYIYLFNLDILAPSRHRLMVCVYRSRTSHTRGLLSNAHKYKWANN
jgi:hypothetical protein